MMYRDNINPIAYLNHHLEVIFEKFLNPSKSENRRLEWQEEFSDVFKKFLMTGTNLPLDMKMHFCVFLMLYPMRQNEEKTFFRLDDNQRVGYLSKYMVKKARTCKVPEVILRRYKNAKSTYNTFIKHATASDDSVYKATLSNYTYIILEICYASNTRSGKLDALLDD